MKSILDYKWQAANIVLMLLIAASALYIFIVDPAGKIGERHVDVRPKDVRQNAQSPQVVAWGQGYIQDPVNNPNDPYGIRMIARGNNNSTPPHDPYGIQQMGKTVPVPGGIPSAAVDKILQEGHWIGLEVIPLTAAIATANRIPENVSGALVDEVTLVSAESGLLAGDVITSVAGEKVTDLKSFKAATGQVAASAQVAVTVYRNGQYMDIAVNAGEPVGIAQMEAAPMILPTDASPHGYYGPCDECHTISKTAKNTGQLRKDAGDVLLVAAPPIRWGSEAPHRERGTCTNCHSVK